jgi:hypothetical protein
VFVGLVIQHVKRKRHIVTCSLSDHTIFYRSTSQMVRFFEEKKIIEPEMYVSIFSTVSSEIFSILRRI